MYDISYDIAAIAISGVLLLCYWRTKKVMNLQNIMFQLMAVANVVTAIFDLTKRVGVLYFHGSSHILFQIICTQGYFIAHSLVLPIVFLYVLGTAFNLREVPAWLKIIYVIPIGIIMGMILSNGSTQIIYHFDEAGNYVRANGIYAVYAMAGYYIVLLIWLLNHYKAQYSHYRRNIFYIVVAITLVGVGIQFFFPQFIVETLFISLSMLLFFFMIQNPHIEIDYNTDLFNNRAFTNTMRERMGRRRQSYVIEIVIDNYDQVRLQDREKIMAKIAQYLMTLGKDCIPYRVDRNVFCLEITKHPEIMVDALASEIKDRFEDVWINEKACVSLQAKICRLSLPGEFTNLESFIAVLTEFVNYPLEDKIWKNSDFDIAGLSHILQKNQYIVKAIEADKVELNYAAVFDIGQKHLYGIYSFVKMMDSSLGQITEGEILQIAEKSGKMVHLNEWAIDQTCQFLSKNPPIYNGVDKIFLKVSASLCLQFGYENFIIETLMKYSIPTNKVCLMISEYTVSKAYDVLKESMPKLMSYHISFCLNGYGNGYTNLASVYELPFKYLRVSKEVVSSALVNEKARTTLEFTLMMSDSLSMQTMASGVENGSQWELLSQMNCDLGDGTFFFGSMDQWELLRFVGETRREQNG